MEDKKDHDLLISLHVKVNDLITQVCNHLNEHKTDKRLLIGAVLTFAVGFALLVIKGVITWLGQGVR